MTTTPSEENREVMNRIIEMMRHIDFSVKEPEYQAQIMKAVKDYASSEISQVLNEIEETIVKNINSMELDKNLTMAEKMAKQYSLEYINNKIEDIRTRYTIPHEGRYNE